MHGAHEQKNRSEQGKISPKLQKNERRKFISVNQITLKLNYIQNSTNENKPAILHTKKKQHPKITHCDQFCSFVFVDLAIRLQKKRTKCGMIID